jgi:hypothetical protein
LKLLRVDRWDSGMYYCTTNSSEKMTEYALEVADAAPIVSSPTGCIVYQDLDQEAKLTCKVLILKRIIFVNDVHSLFDSSLFRQLLHQPPKYGGSKKSCLILKELLLRLPLMSLESNFGLEMNTALVLMALEVASSR